VPILVLTTKFSGEMKIKGRTRARGWLLKPFDPERLMKEVKKVMDQWEHTIGAKR